MEAGRAERMEAAIAEGVRGYRLAMETFRKSLYDAEAEAARDGWIPSDRFMRELDQWIVDLEVEAECEEAASKAR